MPPKMLERFCHLEVRFRSEATVVRFRRSQLLEESLIRDIGEELIRLCDQHSPNLILDFSKVDYLGSSMLAKLLTVARRIAHNGGNLILTGMTPPTYEIFRVGRLNEYFTIAPSVEFGLAALGALPSRDAS